LLLVYVMLFGGIVLHCALVCHTSPTCH
jgi:hypothetical protein